MEERLDFFLKLKIKEKIPDSSIFLKLKNYKKYRFPVFFGETHILIKYQEWKKYWNPVFFNKFSHFVFTC
jgi:hypothetical protein